MRFSTLVSLTGAALLSTTNASYAHKALEGERQQVLDNHPVTVTRTTTQTTWQIELVTKAMSQAHALPTMPIEPPHKMAKAVQTWYGGQKKHGCDKTSCASCRWWYKCQDGEPECFHCDTAPYCEACKVAAEEAAVTNDYETSHDSEPSSRKTCSLAPGRTVPCDYEGRGPIVAFGGDKEAFAASVKMTSHRKTCIINQGTEVPCYSKGDVIVFGD